MFKLQITVEIPMGDDCKNCKFRKFWCASDYYYSGEVCGLFGCDIEDGRKTHSCMKLNIKNAKIIQPTRPDWSIVPDWANWLAMDPRGMWGCYEDKPIWTESCYDVDWKKNGKWDYVKNAEIEKEDFYLDHWDTSLEERPR